MSVFGNIANNQTYPHKEGWSRIHSIDMHTAGEPLRVILSGLPELNGNSVLEYRRNMKARFDHYRTALMFEPRGHADMYGCILLPPNDENADFGILFLHNEGYSTMCGHAVIAITRLAVEMGWVPIKEPQTKVTIDAPCGRIYAFANIKAGAVSSTYFHCVPSFVVALDQQIEVAGIGLVGYDLAYGGAFYAYVDTDQLDISLNPENVQELISKGMAIKSAIMKSTQPIEHPFEEDLSFLYGTIFISKRAGKNCHSRNVCIFAEGEVDRSPTGSGVAGRMAIHHARGDIRVGDAPLIIESILGTSFRGSVVEEVKYGPYQAVVPKVEGTAHVVGQNQWIIDPEDPLKEGFVLR
jgi:trans-L-3-hydroxyproline dehydratase